MAILPFTASVEDIEVDVVIVGGGPTGLLSAILAQQMGLEVAVLDAKDQPLQVGRADALNARSQQYLEVAGILDDLIPLGIRCNTSTTFADGEIRTRQSHWWTGLKHTFHPNFLMLGQPVIESILCSKLKNKVSYGEPMMRITETPEHVIVSTAQRHVRAKFCIGADGARSAVRTALGIPFTGTKPNMVWAVMDTYLDTDFPTCSEIITFQLNGESRVSWIPRERGLSRFYVLLDGEITLEKAQDSVRRHMSPYRIDFVETEWFSEFEIKERVAHSFISQSGTGRVILAGDAAHVHSVNGGQGLNTGVADAFNLIWRLAYILKQEYLPPAIKDEILRSYDIERRHTAQQVIDVAAQLVRKTLHKASDYVQVIEKSAGYITGMGVSYADISSPLVRESQIGLFESGFRVPDLWVTSSNGHPSRLYSMFTYGKYVLLSVGNGETPSLTNFNFVDLLTVRPSKSLRNGHSDLDVGLECFVGPSWVKPEDDYAVLVRPDMYVEIAGDKVKVARYLVDRFGRD